MIKNKIFQDSILIIFFSNSANLINMLIQILLSKELNYSDFSLYYSLIALISYFIIPAATIGMYLQKRFFDLIKKNKDIYLYFWISSKKIFVFFLILFLIFLSSLKTMQESFNNENLYIFFNFFLVLTLIIYMNWPISVNIAFKNYKINSIIYFCTSSLKLLSIFLLFYIFNRSNLTWVVNINLLFTFLLTFFYFIPHKENYIKKNSQIKKISNKIFDNDFKYYVIHSLLIPLILCTDILIAKIYFTPADASKYIIASSLSKIVFFITSGLYSMIFNESLGFSKKNIIITTFLSLCISFITMMSFIYFGDYIIEFIYGEKFEGSHKYLIFLSGAMFVICLCKILCDILIGQKKFGFIKYQILSYCFFIYLMANHFTELVDLARNVFLTSLFLLIFTIFFATKNYYNNKNFAIHKL